MSKQQFPSNNCLPNLEGTWRFYVNSIGTKSPNKTQFDLIVKNKGGNEYAVSGRNMPHQWGGQLMGVLTPTGVDMCMLFIGNISTDIPDTNIQLHMNRGKTGRMNMCGSGSFFCAGKWNYTSQINAYKIKKCRQRDSDNGDMFAQPPPPPPLPLPPPPQPSYLFVITSNNGVIQPTSDGSYQLILNHGDVEKVLVFSDRPYRLVRHITGEALNTMWSEGTNSFADDHPNAAVVINQHVQTVILTSITVQGDHTIFTIEADGQNSLVEIMGACQVFVDDMYGRGESCPGCGPGD